MADMGYVFVQEPDSACWGCAFPTKVNDRNHYPCAASMGDLVKVVTGIAAYAYTALFTERRRSWNYYEVSLTSRVTRSTYQVPRRPDCPLCGARAADKT